MRDTTIRTLGHKDEKHAVYRTEACEARGKPIRHLFPKPTKDADDGRFDY